MAEVDPILSWTSVDPRQSVLFNSYGAAYRFVTAVERGREVTTLYRTVRVGREDKVARLEWDSGRSNTIGRAIIGKFSHRHPQHPICSMCLTDLMKVDQLFPSLILSEEMRL